MQKEIELEENQKVLTEEEARREAVEYIEDSLQYFEKWFLMNHFKELEEDMQEVIDVATEEIEKLDTDNLEEEEYHELVDLIIESNAIYGKVQYVDLELLYTSILDKYFDIEVWIDKVKDLGDDEANTVFHMACDDIQELIEHAITLDGIDHFLTQYESIAEVLTKEGETYYIVEEW